MPAQEYNISSTSAVNDHPSAETKKHTENMGVPAFPSVYTHVVAVLILLKTPPPACGRNYHLSHISTSSTPKEASQASFISEGKRGGRTGGEG